MSAWELDNNSDTEKTIAKCLRSRSDSSLQMLLHRVMRESVTKPEATALGGCVQCVLTRFLHSSGH